MELKLTELNPDIFIEAGKLLRRRFGVHLDGHVSIHLTMAPRRSMMRMDAIRGCGWAHLTSHRLYEALYIRLEASCGVGVEPLRQQLLAKIRAAGEGSVAPKQATLDGKRTTAGLERRIEGRVR